MQSTWEKLIKIIDNSEDTSYSDTVVGEIITPPSDDEKTVPVIKIHGFEIKKNIFFAEHLLKSYQRSIRFTELDITLSEFFGDIKEYEISNTEETNIVTVGGPNINVSTLMGNMGAPIAGVLGTQSIKHSLSNLKGKSGKISLKEDAKYKGEGTGVITYEKQPLKKGDKILVQTDKDGKNFYVIDKFKGFYKEGGV